MHTKAKIFNKILVKKSNSTLNEYMLQPYVLV